MPLKPDRIQSIRNAAAAHNIHCNYKHQRRLKRTPLQFHCNLNRFANLLFISFPLQRTAASQPDKTESMGQGRVRSRMNPTRSDYSRISTISRHHSLCIEIDAELTSGVLKGVNSPKVPYTLKNFCTFGDEERRDKILFNN